MRTYEGDTLHVPVTHVDDPTSVAELVGVLERLHGPTYHFSVGNWQGQTLMDRQIGAVRHRFIIASEGAAIDLHPGDRVRGAPPDVQYQAQDGVWATISGHRREFLWPGDVVCVGPEDDAGAMLHGSATYFEVSAEPTTYPEPRAAFLRFLDDRPGGCAAYPGAFRREALPPLRPPAVDADRQGPNRVNEHTLDMRIDRQPTPIRHYHGPVRAADGSTVNHSETAIVLPRSVYGLPEVDQTDRGHVVIYRRPAADPEDKVVVPVRPGSIVVTPATREVVMGHCFENAFAMLVAIPGFVAPYHMIE